MSNEYIPLVVTVQECAEMTHLPMFAIRRWICEGRFPVIRSGRRIFINMDKFREFLASGTGEGTVSPNGPIPEAIRFKK